MNQVRYGITVFISFIASCTDITSPIEESENLPAIDVPWNEQQSVVCFGTSLTYGLAGFDLFDPTPVGGSPTLPPTAPYKYPELLASNLKIAVYNQGYPGMTCQEALQIIGDSVFTKKPALVLLEFGANDFLRRFDASLTEQYLGRLIDTLTANGSKVVLVSFIHQEMIDSVPAEHPLANRKTEGKAYLDMLRRSASNHSILFVEYAMKDIYWDPDLMWGDFHPNEAGYRIMYENIERALLKTFYQNGMLKYPF